MVAWFWRVLSELDRQFRPLRPPKPKKLLKDTRKRAPHAEFFGRCVPPAYISGVAPLSSRLNPPAVLPGDREGRIVPLE
jgi:hypothetical protein